MGIDSFGKKAKNAIRAAVLGGSIIASGPANTEASAQQRPPETSQAMSKIDSEMRQIRGEARAITNEARSMTAGAAQAQERIRKELETTRKETPESK